MRITNPTNPTPVPPSDPGTSPAPRGETAPASPPSPPAVAAQEFGRVPSFELLSFNALLQHIPPVRAEVVAETVRRLAADQLRPSDTAGQTARVMLGQ